MTIKTLFYQIQTEKGFEVKQAYLTLSVLIFFYINIFYFQDVLPFNQFAVGLVTCFQLLNCCLLTLTCSKIEFRSPLFILLASVLSSKLSQFNKIFCDSANLTVIIQISTILFFMAHYGLNLYRYLNIRIFSNKTIKSSTSALLINKTDKSVEI